jgi:single-stranded DNA-binding protein
VNTFTAIVNLTADVEDLKFGERDVKKLRVADNTFGKDNEARFFDVIVSSKPDMDVAERLAKGDQIVVTGTLVKSSYKAKKNTKYAKKGQSVITDSMPFGRILQVTKSPTFFNQGDAESTDEDAPADDGDETPPELGGEAEGADEPLDGVV